MTTFWLSAGAAAAVILAVLGALQYARSGSNLLVSVRQYEFELPATAQQAFARLAERISPWSDEPLVGMDDDVARGVEAVLKAVGLRVVLLIYGVIRLTGRHSPCPPRTIACRSSRGFANFSRKQFLGP